MALSSVISPSCTCATGMIPGSQVFFSKNFQISLRPGLLFFRSARKSQVQILIVGSSVADARKLDKLPEKELRVLTKLSLSSRPTPTVSQVRLIMGNALFLTFLNLCDRNVLSVTSFFFQKFSDFVVARIVVFPYTREVPNSHHERTSLRRPGKIADQS